MSGKRVSAHLIAVQLMTNGAFGARDRFQGSVARLAIVFEARMKRRQRPVRYKTALVEKLIINEVTGKQQAHDKPDQDHFEPGIGPDVLFSDWKSQKTKRSFLAVFCHIF
jgi:hypothetical protein